MHSLHFEDDKNYHNNEFIHAGSWLIFKNSDHLVHMEFLKKINLTWPIFANFMAISA